MARRRGFLAEVNRQIQIAERNQRQRQVAQYREQQAALKRAESAQRAYERAQAAAARATERERVEAERAAQIAFQEAQQALVSAQNAELADTYSQIDGLLAWTLELDDFVDLESLRQGKPEHPRFALPGDLATSLEPLPPLVYPPEPVYTEPQARTGLFANAKKHEANVARARAEHDAAMRQWYENATQMHANYVAEVDRRAALETDRQRRIAQLRARYDAECAQREADAAAADEELTKLINDLAFDVPSAIEEYVGIVMSNSVYPEAFPVTTEHSFDLPARELTLTVTVPAPSEIPTVKEYKFVKTSGEITSTNLTIKDQKERYASAVWQTAVRSLHEIFEADRAGRIHSIALIVRAQALSAATGNVETVPLVVVGASRETFLSFDLANVVPHATLTHLGAALSRSPLELTPAAAGRGVRAREQ